MIDTHTHTRTRYTGRLHMNLHSAQDVLAGIVGFVERTPVKQAGELARPTASSVLGYGRYGSILLASVYLPPSYLGLTSSQGEIQIWKYTISNTPP